MAMLEQALVFDGAQGPLVGILARPVTDCRAAVLIVAGQPQTRVGAHRMFTDLARELAERGVASLRFDVGGWGDSPGEALPFERSDRDIAAAASVLRAALPGTPPLWLWGLCDGASAAVLALPAVRAAGLTPDAVCLVNPWVRSEASLAAAMVKTYYLKRLMQGEFWARLLTGKIPMANLVHEPLRHLRARFGGGTASAMANGPADAATSDAAPPAAAGPDLPEQLLAQLAAYRGAVYTVLSGNDLTAAETDALMSRDKRWRKRLDRKGAVLRVPGADHTFSDPEHWAAVIRWVGEKARG
jgi:exosortase A-associated hydrolase 1